MKIAHYTSVSLRNLRKSDLDDYYQLVGDSNVMEFISDAVYNYDEAAAELNRLLEKKRKDFTVWAAENENHEFIGVGTLQIENNIGHIGYRVLKKFWRLGYGLQIANCLIQKAKQYKLTELCAEVDMENAASLKILEKLDFTTVEIRTNDLGNEIGLYSLKL